MAFVMMKPILRTAIMMVEIVVYHIQTKNTVQIVHAMYLERVLLELIL